jgi:dTDP-4-dehydrorhamnose reductase
LTILLLGANGQVGWELQRSLTTVGNVIAVTRQELDFQSLTSIKNLLQIHKPSIVINAAAYTQVDKAESETKIAHRINVDAVEIIAAGIKKNNGLFIHYSTDYVFDGSATSPYRETDKPNPLNLYGKTKLLGEQIIAESGCNYIIFRTSWIYAARGKNFIHTILNLAQHQDQLTIIKDQTGSPTSAELIADVTAIVLHQLINTGQIHESIQELYHLTATGSTNWYDYANLIVKTAQEYGIHLKATLIPINSAEYPCAAERPNYSVLNSIKLSATYNLFLPYWEPPVRRTLMEMLRTSPIKL